MESKKPAPRPSALHLSAAQVAATVEASGLEQLEFAARVGCGTSQLWKYRQEGLPPRMNSLVHAAILEQAVQHAVISSNASLREAIRKLKSE